MKRLTLVILSTSAVMAATAHAGGDPALGAQEFKQCAFCHATGPPRDADGRTTAEWRCWRCLGELASL